MENSSTCFRHISYRYPLIFIYPVDLRTPYLGNKIAEKDFAKGQVLIQEMQAAYGGTDDLIRE